MEKTAEIPGKLALARPPARTRIDGSRPDSSTALGELLRFRELLMFLVWRDVAVRYKQTALGVAWVLLQPLLAMLIFTLFFGHLAKMPSDGAPYHLFAYAALLPWNYFSFALAQASNSLVSNSNLISKVYFPRMLLPLSGVLAGLLDLAIASALLVAMLLLSPVGLCARAALAPVFAALGAATALGAGLWLSALHVKYRDIRYVVPFLTQFWMFATPVVYPSSLVPEPWRVVYGLNPMAGVVEGFRWAALGGAPLPLPMLASSAAVSAVLLIGGWAYFRRVEREFADLI